MKLATILNIHNADPVVFDTLESITRYVSHDVLVLVDGAAWPQVVTQKFSQPVALLEGLKHACNRAPYRNVALGLKEAANLFPKADWYCYAEYDVLFASDTFKEYLEKAAKQGAWCLGNDYRMGKYKFPYLEKIIGGKLGASSYLLGACVFYHNEFIQKLLTMGFFERFLYYTNEFSQGFFPDYEQQGGYDISEHLYPTLASHLGGKIGQFAKWSEATSTWEGAYDTFPVRFRPDLSIDYDPYKNASILHPLKTYDHPIREYFRKKRA